jgi:hypothetical protein
MGKKEKMGLILHTLAFRWPKRLNLRSEKLNTHATMNLEELKFGIRLRDRNQNHSQIKINIPNKNRRTNQGDEREDETEPSPNTVVAEPDQIIPSGRRAITSLPPHSHEHRQTSLSRHLLPPPARHHLTLSHAAVSPSLSCLWFCFHVLLSVWFFYCFRYLFLFI